MGGDRGSRALPRGLVTFCLTDIVESTPLWEREPVVMAERLAEHDAIVNRVVAASDGVLVQPQGEGDSTVSAFEDPAAAVRAATAIQQHLESASAAWPRPLQVRIGLHTGPAKIRDGTYFGTSLIRTARLRALGGGGQIVVSSALAGLVRHSMPDGWELRPAGRFTLKGLSGTEDVFVVAKAGSPAVALAVTGDGDGSVPLPATSFVGRERELEQLTELLRSHRLVTVVGPGGAGKTRLAIEAARRLHGAEVPRVVGIDLAVATDDDHALGVLAAALRVADLDGADVDAVEHRLGEALAASAALVLLDNCEHVVDRLRSILSRFVSIPGTATCLLTSQVPVEVPGEVVVPLGGFAVAGDASEAVELFLHRAQARDAGFTSDGSTLTAIEDICRQLEGMPLAIELAATHVRLLSPQEIADRLADDSDRLLSGAEVGPARHRSVAAAVAWSVDLLADEERRLLARLSVFEGGFTAEAAEAVCAGRGLRLESILPLLGRLVHRSLVLQRRQGSSMRFWLLESVRRHARSLLVQTPPERPAMAMRRQGEIWVVSDGANETRFRDAKGLRHLARLIERPGREVHVLDLIAAERGAPGAGVDVDAPLEVLDAAARRQYAERVRDLEEDIDEAHLHHDPERAARLEAELDAVLDQLGSASGLGGRPRYSGGTVERARVSVTKAIRQAIRRVGEHAPEVGRHLEGAVRTGVFCSYAPEPPERPMGVEP